MEQCWLKAVEERPAFIDTARALESLLEEQAEYIQMESYEESFYSVIDPTQIEERM